MGSFLMFGADALDWTSSTFWRSLAGNARAIRRCRACTLDTPRWPGLVFLLNEEIIAKFWSISLARHQTVHKASSGHQTHTYDATSPTASKGRVMADLIDFTMTGTAAALVRVRNRLSAARNDQVRNRYRDRTGQHHRPQRGAECLARRLQPITDALSTRDAAVAALPRLRWVIEQNGIAPQSDLRCRKR